MVSNQSLERATGVWEGNTYTMGDRQMIFFYKLAGKQSSPELNKAFKMSIPALIKMGVVKSENTKNTVFSIVDMKGKSYDVDLTERSYATGVIFMAEGKAPMLVDEVTGAEELQEKARAYYGE